MIQSSDVRDLGLLLQCQTPLIVLETHEETRALQMLKTAMKGQHSALYCWSVVQGLSRIDLSLEALPQDNKEPLQVLQSIAAMRHKAIIVLFDFHPYLQDASVIRLLKEIALQYEAVERTIVLISHRLEVPAELRRLAARMELRLPSSDEIRQILVEEGDRYREGHDQIRVRSERDVLDKLTRLLTGLTENDVRRLVRNIIYDDGAITADELPEINRAKFELLDMDGVVSFEYDTAHFADVGGLRVFKKWLTQRAAFFSNVDKSGIDAPKGALLVGVQGGGKSLAAKASAGLLGLPLLRLDMGALYNKFHGETERNLRDALKLAEAVAPCVLWIDELEKGISSGSSDEGTSKRVLGTLLTWLAERKPGIFVVATANVIADLPPELIRKGRFDELFFIDLPEAEIRAEIFAIHLRKRAFPVEQFDLALLAQASDGFSGAEIEQVIVAGRYSALSSSAALSTALLLQAIEATQPLSVVMAEHIAALREWADGRTVRAD